MDARLLDNLTKRELEKHLGVTRKAHQTSIVQGITFLRMIKYDRQAINERRKQCDVIDCDPLVWTNQRFITWARGIDLAEYADNLRGILYQFFVQLHATPFLSFVRRFSYNREWYSRRFGRSGSNFQRWRHGDSYGYSRVKEHNTSPFSYWTGITRPNNPVNSGKLKFLFCFFLIWFWVIKFHDLWPIRARYEQRSRQARSERKRVEKMDGNASLGRNLSRSFTTGLVSSDPNQEDIYGRSTENNGMFGIKSNVKASFHVRMMISLSVKHWTLVKFLSFL